MQTPQRLAPALAISVVSHGHGAMLGPLLNQLEGVSRTIPLEVVVVRNLPEPRPEAIPGTLPITWIDNAEPMGFAENHNAAFRRTTAPYFCVLNPDVVVTADSFAPLLDALKATPGVVGPRVESPAGGIEDSARRVPGVLRLAVRWLARRFEADYDPSIPMQQVDWLAGMCLVFDRASFEQVGGFDPRYRLYCEDVDVCLRLHLQRRFVGWIQNARVVHDAQRDSRRNPRYMLWHIKSLLMLLTSRAYWQFRIQSKMTG
ncbi:glycosyltransferase [Cupriavidus respiraculi]|nr:glycosyltransferase [Cupriavidus respiraculi]